MSLPENLAGSSEIVWLWLLIACRFAPVLGTPWLVFPFAPWGIKIGVALLLSGVLIPPVAGSSLTLPTSLYTALPIVLREITIGSTFAVASALPLYALGWAGRVVEGAVARPMGERASKTQPIETLYLMAGTALFVSLGGQRLGLRVFADSLVTAPVGQFVAQPSLAWGLGCARLIADALAFAISIAIPSLLAITLVELGLGFLPQGHGVSSTVVAGSPFRAALALLAILASFPVVAEKLPDAYHHAFESARNLLARLIQ